MTLVFDRWISH